MIGSVSLDNLPWQHDVSHGVTSIIIIGLSTLKGKGTIQGQGSLGVILRIRLPQELQG